MKKRMLWGPLAVLAALYAVRMGLRMSSDVRRYNRILAMSDEEPLAQKTPRLVMQVLSEQRATGKEWLQFFATFPSDLMRYLRMESM